MEGSHFLLELCNERNFTVWNKHFHHFGYCFMSLCVTFVTHAFLAIVSSYHFSRHHSRRVRGNIPRSHSLNIRFAVTILLALLPCILFATSFITRRNTSTVADKASWIVEIIGFIVHSGFIWRLRRYYHVHIRGPVVVVFAFITTTFALLFHLYNIIHDIVSKENYFDAFKEYEAYMKTVFHFIYLITLLPSKRPAYVPNPSNIQSINATEDEQRPLLNSQREHRTDINESLGIACHKISWLSYFFFIWVNPLMYKGYKQKLKKSEDLFHLPSELETSQIVHNFQKAIVGKPLRHRVNVVEDISSDNAQRSESLSGKQYKSVIKALNTAFGLECWSLGILKFLGDSLNFAGPILLNLLVSYMENSNEITWHGYVYAAALFTSTFLSSMISTQFGFRIAMLGLKVRAALITSVYKKALSVSTVALSRFSTGEIVNFMSTDTDRIVNFAPSFHQFWSLPIQVGISLYLLYNQVGLAFLAGIGFAILLIPINRWLAVKIGQLSTLMMKEKDSRVKIMNEILFGIRVIKFYAWEKHFSSKVDLLRNAELKSLKGRKYLDAWCVFFWATTTVMISILTFTTYVLLGHKLTAAKVFTSIALFNILIMPLNAFPWTINGLMEAWVSVKRIEKYLQLSECDIHTYYSQELGDKSAVDLKHCKFSWHAKPTKNDETNSGATLIDRIIPKAFTLKDLTLSISKGQLIGVIGRVGCGKSSFLNAVLAEMCRNEGNISILCIKEGFGYASQEAWIQHATVKDNILFGKSYDVEKYEKVINACALKEDLKILPGGDMTEIGENGVTLSGGQKARVALARAVYQDKSVYLLDDPFAAVDTHVANHIYKRCIKGLLCDKTIILCTHHTQYLKEADHVIVLEDGAIIEQGNSDDVLTHLTFDEADEQRKRSESNLEEAGDNNVEQVTLVEEEEQNQGIVKFEVYKIYWLAVGSILAPVVLLSLFLMQASKNTADWWLSYWVTHSHSSKDNITMPTIQAQHTNSTPWQPLHYGDDNAAYYLTVYGSIVGANVVFALARSFSFAYGGVCAATKIHKQLLNSLLKAPIKFFDTTPIGRILNRFSSDMYSIDDSLPFILNIFLAQFYGLLGSLVVTCYGLPWFIVVLIPLTVVYFFIQRYYRHTSREVKRISSVTLSPIYAHFSETVSGLTVIRASREQSRFVEVNRVRLEENQKSQLSVFAASTWLGIRLQMIGVTMVTAVAFIAVIEHHFKSVNPGLVGLAISYALSITQLISGMVQEFTETEKQMVSVERAAQYIDDVPHERQEALLHTPDQWPIEGRVIFEDVKLQYRDGLPLALDGVSFMIKPSEKIGIVGRTGSGKSSLFLSLFRMVEIQSGEIVIDGVNTEHIMLNDLRSRMAIIPQDPFLFSGTIRENLDPEGHHDDHSLFRVIERCYLTDVVQRFGGLDADVQERGKDFSVGQRQLLCLARALLTKAKILCIDEATASVDKDTDEKLQATIQSEFHRNTVLTIAHRISTIQHSDRILVMDNAKVAEFDTPNNLMQNSRSLFYKLVNEMK